jgi:drug/metabolite transporter (DMT)-like permease
MKSLSSVIRLGGIALAGGALAFMVVFARWIGWVGVVTAVAGFIGMFRNVTVAVAPVAAVNNYLLPLFMIILGVAFVRWPLASELT